MVLSIKSWIGKLFKKNKKHWKEYEYFDESWKVRIEMMASFIQKDETVCDLGCGKMWLKEFLNSDTVYYGVDYTRRDELTKVCDFNKGEFPNLKPDVFFVSGCLEYIMNYDEFIGKIATQGKKCILSYCISDFLNDTNKRAELGWKNHISKTQLQKIFENKGMNLKLFKHTPQNYFIFIFEK